MSKDLKILDIMIDQKCNISTSVDPNMRIMQGKESMYICTHAIFLSGIILHE